MLTKFFDIEFRRDGSLHDDSQLGKLLEGLKDLTDLAILSHGWNNDMAEARGLYKELGDNIDAVAAQKLVPGLDKRKMGMIRVYWPSKKFADTDLIPGGGAASEEAANDNALITLLDELGNDPIRLGEATHDADRTPQIVRAKQLVDQLEDKDAQREFVQCLRAVLNPDEKHIDDGSAEFFSSDPIELFRALSEPVDLPRDTGAGGAADAAEGGAAGIRDRFRGLRAAARRLLNYATYYQMKSRAGTVGRGGAALMLAHVRNARPELPLHLVGHSFGARLVTASAATLRPHSPAISMTLLQAAFSHNGFADNFDGSRDGAFRGVLADKRVSGPILITHTKNDKAVGIAYPLASRISRDRASAIGDRNDPFGGMGRNGAQHTPEVATDVRGLLPVGKKYAFARGKVFNLHADAFIKSHGDVRGVEVAHAFLSAVAAASQ